MTIHINNEADLLKYFGQDSKTPFIKPFIKSLADHPIYDSSLVPVRQDGYLYTIGNSKASIIFMELISTLPKNHIGYITKHICNFFTIINTLKDNPFKQYILTLVYENTYTKASKYLTTPKQKTYLTNVLKTKLKVALKATL